jgi:hypothetical protein
MQGSCKVCEFSFALLYPLAHILAQPALGVLPSSALLLSSGKLLML